MSVVTKVGTFTLRSGTGGQAITGLGFTPKLVFLNGIPKTTDGALNPGAGASGSQGILGGGVFTDSAQYAWCRASQQDVGSGGIIANLFTSEGDDCYLLTDCNGSLIGRADVVSLDADGFTINVAAAFAAQYRVSYYAIGGTSLQIKLGSFTPGTDVLGVKAVGGVGFKPRFIAILRAKGGSLAPNWLAFGAAACNGEWAVSGMGVDDDAFHDASKQQSRAGAYTLPATPSAGLATVHSRDPDGFSLDVTQQHTGNEPLWYIAIKGGQHHVARRVISAAGSVAVPTGFPVRGVLTAGADGGQDAQHDYSAFGFTDGVAQRAHAFMHHFGSTGRSDSFVTGDYFGINYYDADGDVIVGGQKLGSLDADGFTSQDVLRDPPGAGFTTEGMYWAIGDGNVLGGCPQGPPAARASFDLTATVKPTAARRGS